MAINFDAPIEIRDNRNGSWYWVHTHILRDPRLSASEKVIYSTIASYTNQQQTSYPSIKRIAEDSGVAQRHVYRCLKKLEKFKLISIKRQAKQGMNNIYTLLKTLPNGGDDIMSGVTNRHQGGDNKTLGGGDKSALLTRTNITRSINKKYATLSSLEESDYQEIADKYRVPISFVRSKHDDLINYCGAKGKAYRNYRLALMDWVKRDSLKLRKEASEHVSKRGIDARGIQ